MGDKGIDLIWWNVQLLIYLDFLFVSDFIVNKLLSLFGYA
jgi:hypothetical protein